MISNIPELEDLPSVKGKNVLVRVDFNVPIVKGVISDDLRIRAALPTIQWLEGEGATVTLCSHLGRPKGKVDPAFSLDPVRERLQELGVSATLRENLRFNPGEKANDAAFVAELIDGQDLYVNDAFGVCHRRDASTVGPPKHLPSAIGRLVSKELAELQTIITSPRKPFVAVMGGLKISDKLRVVESLLAKVDALIIGGAMAFTFLKASGKPVGSSLVEDSMIDTCKKLLEGDVPIHLPTDSVALPVGAKFVDPSCEYEAKTYADGIPDEWMGVDIGSETAVTYASILKQAGTIFWNGPVGVFEDPRCSAGTKSIASALAHSDAFTMVGGGDSASAAAKFGVADQVDHISTGGGASLAYIETGSLVALEALVAEVQQEKGE